MSATDIVRILGRRVWDSRGQPTVEAEVQLAGGASGRAIAPAGASRGRSEAVELRDGGAAFGGKGVGRAVGNVNGPIAERLTGLDAVDQAVVDAALIELDGTRNKERLGANATVAVSMAAAHAAAASKGMALWRHLAGDAPTRLPLPQIQIFGGGAHAARRIDIQDIMVVPVAARSFDQATAMVAEVYRAAGRLMAERGLLAGVADEGGYWPAFDTNEDAIATAVAAIEAAGLRPGEDVAIALDVAASELYRDGRYHLARGGRVLDGDAMAEMALGWLDRFPVVSIEDPLADIDEASWRRFTAAASARVQIVGDDLLVTDADRITRAAQVGLCNAALIKPNQVGTLSEARAALVAARAAGFSGIVSARSGESEDVTIVHLAVGWDASQLKVGSFSRSERMAKWNEALRIEAALGLTARFAGRAALPVRG